MKPTHLLIAGLSIIVVILLVMIVKTKKKNDQEKAAQDVSNHLLATVSTTTMVHPITQEELIVSPSGVNAIDQSEGTYILRSTISSVLNDAVQMSGSQPAYITLKTYSSTGQLMGSQTIANPNGTINPSGVPAHEKVFEGTINYSCSKDQQLEGPGYYESSGDTLFGMYCN